MKRSHVGIIGIGILIAAAAAVWFFFVRAPAPSAKKPPAIATSASPSGSAAAEPAKPPPPSGPELRWEWDRDPEGPLRLDGQVVDQDGEPVGDALIVISTQPPATTRSQADGSFFFDKLVARRFTLSARAGARVGSVQTKLTSTSDPVVLRVRAGATVAVLVHDEAEKPIAGATVRLEGSEDFGASAPTATTSAEGKALLSGVEGGWTSVVAEAPGYARGAVSSMVGAASPDGKPVAELSLTLLRGVAVSGQVVDERGKPVAGARVSYDTSGFGLGGGGRGEAKSDDKGGFRFAALAPGQYTFGASDGEHVRSLSTPIEVGAQPVRDVLITLRTGGSVRGTVVDRAGAAVPFAVVRIAPHPDGGMREAMIGARQVASDERGAFEIRGLPRARLQLRAEGEAAASAILEVSLVEAARQEGLQVVLDVEGAISGVVVNERGEPMPELSVRCAPDFTAGAALDSFALTGMSSTTSDGSGAFTVRGLPPGAYRLWVDREGASGAGYERSQPAKPGDRDVRIVVAAPGRILGKIATGEGKAPALAKVSLSMTSQVTTRDGAFVLAEVEPGKYDVRMRGPDFAERVLRDVQVSAGKDTDLGTITVVRGRRVTGLVVDGEQRPVAGAKVRLAAFLVFEAGNTRDLTNGFDDMQGVATATSDATGAFTLTGVSSLKQSQLAAETAQGRSEVATVPPGEGDPPPFTLRLRSFGSIAGAVTVNGKPAGRVSFNVQSKDAKASAAIFATSNEDGSYVLERIPEGTYTVSAQRAGAMSMRAVTADVKVVAGRRSKLDFDIEEGKGATLEVQVSALPSQEVNAAQILLFEGAFAATTGQELMSSISRAIGVAFWMGGAVPAFKDVKAGPHTVCGLPITGPILDSRFSQRLQENMGTLAVYCKPVTVTAAARQTFPMALPAMRPLPESPAPQ